MHARPFLLALLAAALLVQPVGGARPASFTPNVTNPWFPLRPGTVYVYHGVKDGKPTRDVVTVTRRTVVVAGVRCTVVSDLLYTGGRLSERTRDWYAQDADGNVWYFGEDTAELDRQGRVVTREGSWRAGRDGARAGIFMPSAPRRGQTGRQEFYRGRAEDHFRVVALRATVNVPYTSSRAALLTEEWTPLEPGVRDRKVYVRGVGLVQEQTVKGGDERAELVAVR